MKFSNDAILQAAATLAAAQLQAQPYVAPGKMAPAGTIQLTPHSALLTCMQQVLGALQLLEQQEKTGQLTAWARFAEAP